jgi:phosphomevalonate kinase
MIVAEAPGKLVIAGEYAVLAGAPGLAVAVGVRATARIVAISGNGNQLSIPDTGESFRFRLRPEQGLRWDGVSPGALGLPLEATSEILAAEGLLARELPAFRVELSSAAFHHVDARGQRQKLGLGSSAAVVVALTGALLKLGHQDSLPRPRLLEICCEAHRRLQGGSGSGIDVATSLTGGVVSLAFPRSAPSRLPVDEAPAPNPTAQPVSWPQHLRLVAVWTGVSASTPAMLARLRLFRERDQARFAGHMERLATNAARAVQAWQNDDTESVLAAIAGYDTALRQLDDVARIGIYSAEHRELKAIAQECGAVYKPSGAGGGDFGVALTDARDTEQKLRKSYEAAGFMCLDAELGAPGLSVRLEDARAGSALAGQ